MDDQATRRARRRAIAFILVLLASAMVVVEPFPSGAVLVSLTRSHGVDVGDLPAVGVYLVAAALALWSA